MPTAIARSADLAVFDAGPAPDEGACLRLLAQAEVGCWFDRRAVQGRSLLLVEPTRILRSADRCWPGLRVGSGTASGPAAGFTGGWAGWISYEGALSALGLPMGSGASASVGYYPAALVVDHAQGRAWAVGRGAAGRSAAQAWLVRLRALGHPAAPRPPRRAPRVVDPGPTLAAHAVQVRRVQEWITAGETYVANLTYRVQLAGLDDPAGTYAVLAAQQRAPYAALLRDRDRWVLCSSPELLLARHGILARTRPIKGTRAGGAAGPGLDADPKERAELTMIVDVERNDLGSVARTGSVRVPELFAVERHPGLEHLVAAVEAEVPGPAGRLLAAMLPGGSVTGAPKRRTVELLGGLETSPRGVYTGTVGFCDDGGDMEWNVAIRTLEVSSGLCRYGTGGGITIDSAPAREYAETRLKARGPLRALGVPWD